MPLIITEFAIQADGTYSIELYNTGPGTVDSTENDVGFTAPFTGHTVQLSAMGVPNPIPVGVTFTVGHSSIAANTYSNPATDASFSLPGVNLAEVIDYGSGAGVTVDHIGVNNGFAFPVDGSYQDAITRTPNPDNNVNSTSEFTHTTPFSTNTLMCFLAGTRIATPTGEVPVETLGPGDMILTADHRTVPVRFNLRQTVRRRIGVLPKKLEPVRILAGALGPKTPHSDLTVTADHGMILDGMVVNAAALVNGHSIDWVPMAELPDSFTVYHVETEAHDIILANGAPSETFVDIPGRMAFDNYAEYLSLYGTERIIPEMPSPRITSRRLLPDATRARLGIADDRDAFYGGSGTRMIA